MSASSLSLPMNCTLPEKLQVTDQRIFCTVPHSYHPSYDEVFLAIGEDIRRRGHLTKIHISALAAWKRLNLSSRWAKSLQELPDSGLAEMSASLFEEEFTTEERISMFWNSKIPGFSSGTFAVASTVLGAWRPLEFGITDRRSREALKSFSCGCSDDINRYTTYLAHLHAIRDWAFESDNALKTARQIDCVLFTFGPAIMENLTPRRS